jgi:hypothetical protein
MVKLIISTTEHLLNNQSIYSKVVILWKSVLTLERTTLLHDLGAHSKEFFKVEIPGIGY